MATSQAAINGINKALEFSQRVAAQSKFYSKTRNQLLEIRELAVEVIMSTSNVLGDVEFDDPKCIVVPPSNELITGIDIEALDEREAKDLLVKILAQVNVIEEQTINADTVVVAETANFTILPGENFEKSGKLPKTYVKDFKSIVKKVASLPTYKFSSKLIRDCALMCDEYFGVRFDRRNDYQGVHKFSQDKFNNYLVSVILAYSHALECNCLERFIDEFEEYIELVKLGNCPYTFSKSIGYVFFQIVSEEKFDLFGPNTYQLASEIWEELWELGYNQLASMKLPESLILDKTFVFNVSKLLVDRDITEGTRLIDNLDTLSANDSVIADYDEFDIAFARIQQEFSDEIYIKYDTLKDLYHRYIVYRDYMGEENLRDLAEIQNHKYPIYDESRSIDRSLVPCVFIRYVINHPNNLTELSNHICDLEHVMDTAESVGKDMEDVKIGLAQLDDWFSDLYNVYEYYYENFAE